MPTVRRVERQVGIAALPGVRKSAAETPLSTGAGVEEAQGRTAETWARLSGAFMRMGVGKYTSLVEQERQRANQIALLNAENQLASWENQRLYDPEKGALTVRGKDSFGLPEQLKDEFTTLAGTVEQGLSTPEQRINFTRLRMQRQATLDLTIRRHVFGEMQRYEGQELQALVENAQSSAVANALDPARVGVELTRAVSAIRTHAPRLGMGPEQVQKQVEAVTSATHVGVIERLLANEKDKAAQVYFEETKSQISGDAMGRVEKALEEGTLRGEAQRKSETILAAGGTLTQQREKAKALDDPKLRDAVLQRLEHEASVSDREQRETEEAEHKQAFDLVDKTHSVTSIPPALWSRLPGDTRSALRGYALRLAKGEPVETDLATYYGLMKQAADNPETFATDNLLKYRAKLGETEFKQLAGLQLSIRTADTNKVEKDLGAFRTHDQVLQDTLALYGIETRPSEQKGPERQAIAQLRRMLDQRMQAFGELTGKKPTNDDIQRTLDQLLSQSVTVPGSWWNIWPGGKSFTDTTKRLLDFSVGDIPTDERTQIESALRKARRPVSDATVLDLYLETRSRTGK